MIFGVFRLQNFSKRICGTERWKKYRSLEICLILALPAAAALIVASEEIIRVLFERGAFTAQQTRVTSYVLTGYAIGLPAYIMVKVLSTAYWARRVRALLLGSKTSQRTW